MADDDLSRKQAKRIRNNAARREARKANPERFRALDNAHHIRFKTENPDRWLAYMRAKTERRKDKAEAYRKKWESQPGTPERLQEYRKKWRELHPHHRTARKLASYGMSMEQYDSILRSQKSVCAICKNPETASDKRHGKVRSLAVDHHHLTGAVRGLLCAKCNRGIGLFKGDPTVILAAARYLEKHGIFSKEVG